MKPSVIFANMTVSVRGDRRLNRAGLRRLADSSNVDEALRVLYEAGYGEGRVIENRKDYHTLIDTELERTIALFEELNLNKDITDCFLSEYRYHNAKVFYKARQSGDVAGAYTHFAGIEQTIINGKYIGLPEPMENALKTLDQTKDLTSRLIDATIDRAYYEDVFSKLKKIRNRSITEYFKTKAELNDITTLIRARTLNLDFESVLPMLINTKADYRKMYEDISLIGETFKERNYYPIIKRLIADVSEDYSLAFAAAEVARDNHLLGILRRDIDNYFKIDGVIYYYVSRVMELKTARMIMVLLNNGIERAQIMLRLRDIR